MMLQLNSLLFTQMSWTHMYTLNLACGFHRKFCPSFWRTDIIKMSVNRWMYKQHLVHPYNEILFSDKKEIKKLELELLSFKRHGKHPNENCKCGKKKSIWKGFLCESNYVTFLEKLNYGDNWERNNQWSPSPRVEDGVNRLVIEDFVLFWQ